MRQKQVISIFRLYHPLVVTALLCLFLSGCSKDEEEYQAPPLRTLLFYMGGDNNLSGEIDPKIEQLKNVPVPASCRLIIYSDSQNTRPSLQEAGNGKLTVIREYEESNSADAEVFSTVLGEVMELYPAPSYGLVLFSHASGWMPEGTYNNPAFRSVVADNGAEMNMSDFAASIPDNMFDYIVFEACFMAGVEVAYELKDKTKFIVGSSAELVSPGFKPIYTEAIPLLFKPTADLRGFCRMVESSYNNRLGDYGSLTLSLIDTKGVDGIAQVLKGASVPSTIENTQTFSRYGKTLFFDLYDSFSSLDPNIQTELQAAIEACVIWKGATKEFMPTYGGFEVLTHSGLTSYISQERYRNLNEAYKKLSWYKAVFE